MGSLAKYGYEKGTFPGKDNYVLLNLLHNIGLELTKRTRLPPHQVLPIVYEHPITCLNLLLNPTSQNDT